ncbi:anti-sigma factor [Falsiroseomonas selenitidurans]|uniref:Regulator of SigK n=1 Tax=Falsiroseomonas selenitidurans TaxID=2716335 RepID=A0ABX1E039_9PROT|nr:anti-sigma factor [Falsiroseomonas selenitidurans]NKC30509.1 RNA polymerase subunit sigma-70 [Falsiroseomonas selenitidurans]
MSGLPLTPDERDALAAEYVLGTLEAREAAAVAAALPNDPALAEAVAAWEARLAPLAALAPPEAPPPGLWQRIEAALDPAPPPAPTRKSWLATLFDPWRAGALGATALAAGLAAFILLRPEPEPRLMTVLLTERDQPAWLVEADGGGIRLASLNPRPAPEGRVLELWALPQGATAPTSLGLIPAEGRIAVSPSTIRPSPGMLIEITLEPPGGSPIGRPTGPILFIGRLAPAVGS